jgi:outer membrane lipoprotein-sorting protein
MKNLSVLVLRALIVPFLVISSVSAPRSLRGQDGQAYQALYSASERYYGLETLCAHFQQVVELTLLRQTRSSEGTVCLQQPDLFSMRFADPEGDLVVVDREFAWTFYPSQDDRQVMQCSVEGAGSGFNFYTNFLEDPRGRFEAVHEGREPMGEGLSHRIALEPRETGGLRSADFRSAVIWLDVDSYLITALEIHDTNESIRRVRLTEIRVDIEIPDDVFRFVRPEGARLFTPPGCAMVIPG